MRDRLKFLTLMAFLLGIIPGLPIAFQFDIQAVQAQSIDDRQVKADRLLAEGFDLYQVDRFEEALTKFEEALSIYREMGDLEAEDATLNQLAEQYRIDRFFDRAIDFYQQLLRVRQKIGDIEREAWAWARLGNVYFEAAQYKQGLDAFQEALALQQLQNDRLGEAQLLGFLGWAYLQQEQEVQAGEFFGQSLAIYQELVERETEIDRLKEIDESLDSTWENVFLLSLPDELELEFYELALSLSRKLGDRSGEAQALKNLGNAYFDLQQYDRAVELHQEYLIFNREISGVENDIMVLPNLLFRYSQGGQFDRAIAFYQPYLDFVRESGNREAEANALSELGLAALNANRPDLTVEFYQQSLEIYRKLGNRYSQLSPLRDLGDTYVKLGEYDRAMDFYRQFLALADRVYNRQFQADFLNGHIARILWSAQQYDRTISLRQEALEIYRALGKKDDEARVWKYLGDTYRQLEQTDRALEAYQQSLALFQDIGDRSWQVLVLQSLSDTYRQLQQYDRALDFFQQVISIHRETGDRDLEILALRDIGDTYLSMGNVETAWEFHQQYLALSQATNDRLREVVTFNELGEIYQEHQQYDRAFAFYQHALNLSYALQEQPEFSSFDLVGNTLGKIGSLLAAQDKVELAIVFYKAAIDAYERIRGEFVGNTLVSESEFASVFLGKHEADYRTLADLLLQQNRILEAQRVLDLLRVEELDNYLQNVRGNARTAPGVPKLAAEREIEGGYQAILDRAISLGRELTELREKSDRSPAEEQRLLEITTAQETLISDFNTFISSDEVAALIAQLTPETRKPDLVDDLEDLIGLQDNLRNLQPNAILLYPLILDERLELILTTPDSPPIRRTVDVSKEQLTAAILAFRQALNSPQTDAKISAQQLYQWLIEPIQNDLNAANAETIIYAPDGQLRYIPLAALHDGDRWLVERYRINHITATSLTDLDTQPQSQLKVLAGAFTTGRYNLTVGEESFEFDGLPYAAVEVATLAETVADTTQLLDAAFNPDQTKLQMGDRTILHFATHGAIAIGSPEDSFILFGDGTPVTIAEVRNWNLNHIDLVVLSACETGLGGNLGTGTEILGLGYQMQRAGAKAAIASLWAVNDGGTQVLMNGFYRGLQGGMTKAEALQQAQIALITGEYTAEGGHRGIAIAPILDRLPRQATGSLSHPYYWAPFILIGNGL